MPTPSPPLSEPFLMHTQLRHQLPPPSSWKEGVLLSSDTWAEVLQQLKETGLTQPPSDNARDWIWGNSIPKTGGREPFKTQLQDRILAGSPGNPLPAGAAAVQLLWKKQSNKMSMTRGGS